MFVEGAISQLNEDGTPRKDRYFLYLMFSCRYDLVFV